MALEQPAACLDGCNQPASPTETTNPNQPQSVELTGAGATFPNPIYSKWFAEYKKVDPSVSFNYQPIGSGGGQKQIIEGTVDFGASDGPMSDESLAKAPVEDSAHPDGGRRGGDHLQPARRQHAQTRRDRPSPTSTWARSPSGTIPPSPRSTAAPTLPATDIAVAHRADGSGTSFHLHRLPRERSAPIGRAKVGKPNTTVNWPAGIGGKGNDGVAGLVKQTAGAIGYVELIYALQNKLQVADLKNADGEFVKPTLEGITAAMATANIPDDFRFSMVNAPGKDSYPISGATWLLVYEQQKDAAKGKALVGFLEMGADRRRKQTKALDYAPLPDAVQKKVLDRIATIKM